ncbi:hypothetical protein J4Q44_G00206600 [Coregonus suidteri]|uniref:Uncharacterized protein n=1 Tax=Coregonus suidteri TaxID=861788 RepID=A0AAN8LC81_9TELE
METGPSICSSRSPSSSHTGVSPVGSVLVNGKKHYLGVKLLMAASYSNVNEPGLLFQQYPPALLPKPGKENARLQKLLKKTEKKITKKAAPENAKTPVPFRSSLSPVNEASPDLEHSDHSTPPKTPEAPFYTQHPRFAVRPVYRHVASPYPQQRGATFGGTASFSPQLYAAPAPTFPHCSCHSCCYTTYSANSPSSNTPQKSKSTF